MEEKGYNFSKRTDKRYEFTSVSENKIVQKVVIFSRRENENVFNMALLDILANGKYSDLSVTNNNDFRTVMATVFTILEEFLNEFPESIVSFKGSDARRHRLCRIIISKELDLISNYYYVFGAIDDKVLEFEKNKDYELFIIRKK